MPNFFNTPLIPQAPVQAVQKAIAPTANSSPWGASIRGFGQGALEGLRNLSTPTNIALAASSFIPGLGAAGEAGEALESGSGALQGLSKAIPAATETLGEVSPEFTPVGGEDFYNTGKQLLQKAADPMEAVYNKIMGGMGK